MDQAVCVTRDWIRVAKLGGAVAKLWPRGGWALESSFFTPVLSVLGCDSLFVDVIEEWGEGVGW